MNVGNALLKDGLLLDAFSKNVIQIFTEVFIAVEICNLPARQNSKYQGTRFKKRMQNSNKRQRHRQLLTAGPRRTGAVSAQFFYLFVQISIIHKNTCDRVAMQLLFLVRHLPICHLTDCKSYKALHRFLHNLTLVFCLSRLWSCFSISSFTVF